MRTPRSQAEILRLAAGAQASKLRESTTAADRAGEASIAFADDPEAKIVARIIRRVRAAGRRPQAVETRLPASAAIDALGPGSCAPGIYFHGPAISLKEIQTPFPDIAGHVFETERTGAQRKSAHRRSLGIAVVNLVIAPGKDRVPVGKIGQIAAAVVITPRI